MRKVGLTGGIGSGKSYVSQVFSALGVPVFDADPVARQAYADPLIRKQVILLLGSGVYEDNRIIPEEVSALIFSHPDLLSKLNSLIHPWVQQQFLDWTARMADHPYVIKEAAILFESGSYRQMDQIICVWAPDQMRLQRVMNRDKHDAAEVRHRMRNQWDQEEIRSRSDFSIINDGTNLVIPQILKIHQTICSTNG